MLQWHTAITASRVASGRSLGTQYTQPRAPAIWLLDARAGEVHVVRQRMTGAPVTRTLGQQQDWEVELEGDSF